MNSEKHPYIAVFAYVREFALKVNYGRRRLPVVCVHNVGIEVHDTHKFHNSLAEISEAFAVVIAAVKHIALEIIFIVNEIICDIILLV